MAATLEELARAQVALDLLDAVALEWDLAAQTVRATPYGAAAWVGIFEDGRLGEDEFLGALDDSSVLALRDVAASLRRISATVPLRFAEGTEGPSLLTRWVRQPGRVLGVAIPVERDA